MEEKRKGITCKRSKAKVRELMERLRVLVSLPPDTASAKVLVAAQKHLQMLTAPHACAVHDENSVHDAQLVVVVEQLD